VGDGWESERSPKLNDRAGLGTRRDSDGVRIGSGGERLVRRFRLATVSLFDSLLV
jgi:hypothetical protein